ncbi:hypothetical protein GKZ89_17965 [Bacillus mangrovi]|uniref:Uncharacterized protein n=1 Tax=Metabacillus mangrovi TaxID=1491830 RepID=A0A7X2S8M3_9BACI|nr:hypothetical protein [Metabacillus mangrovi]MTH55285.1 hypothetical protein [Metabacillus mangrovi]
MILKAAKKMFFLLGTILLVPAAIGLAAGGGFVFFSLLNGSSLDASLRKLVHVHEVTKPYLK